MPTDVETPLLGADAATAAAAGDQPQPLNGEHSASFAQWNPADRRQEDSGIEAAATCNLSSKAGGVANLIVSAVGGK